MKLLWLKFQIVYLEYGLFWFTRDIAEQLVWVAILFGS